MLKVSSKIKLNYLVTGTGRCGSVYMARLLTSLGINCTHEAIFNYMGLEFAKDVLNNRSLLQLSHCSTFDILKDEPIETWINTNRNIKAESSYMAAPFLEESILKNVKIIHVVRNPLKVVSSFYKDIGFFAANPEDPWLNFVIYHMPEIEKIENHIEKTCYYYTNWNKMIESKIKFHSNIRHKVEDKCSQQLLDFLKIKDNPNAFKDETINSWKKRQEDMTLNEIPDGTIKKEFIEIGERYGYF